MARPSGLTRPPRIPARPDALSPQRLTVQVKAELSYLLALPPEYHANEKKRWPLVVFLHGIGERGANLTRVRRHGLPRLVAAGKTFPFILVAPQCPANTWWNAAVVDAFAGRIQQLLAVDPRRVYLTGLSMGGFGTWATALHNPRRYAALVPVCGGGEVRQAEALCRTPVWAFHGAKDLTVPVQRSREMIRAVRKAGGHPRLTVYPETGHNAWDQTYADERLYRWMLAQRTSKKRTL